MQSADSTAALDETRRAYAAQKVGGGRVGFGEKAALLIVDFQHMYTRGRSGCGTEAVERTAELLDVFRGAGLPVAFVRVVYRADGSDRNVWLDKAPGLAENTPGSENVEIDPIIAPFPGEPVIDKRAASGFFATGVVEMFRGEGVDTVVVCGASTSGCVRATVVDGLSHDFRMIVPRECVADRSELAHELTLFDIDTKYGDVEDLVDVMDRVKASVA